MKVSVSPGIWDWFVQLESEEGEQPVGEPDPSPDAASRADLAAGEAGPQPVGSAALELARPADAEVFPAPAERPAGAVALVLPIDLQVAFVTCSADGHVYRTSDGRLGVLRDDGAFLFRRDPEVLALTGGQSAGAGERPVLEAASRVVEAPAGGGGSVLASGGVDLAALRAELAALVARVPAPTPTDRAGQPGEARLGPDRSEAERPAEDPPGEDQPAEDRSVADQPLPGRLQADQSQAEQRVEVRAAEGRVDAPAAPPAAVSPAPSLADPGVPSEMEPGVPSVADPGVPSEMEPGVPAVAEPGVPAVAAGSHPGPPPRPSQVPAPAWQPGGDDGGDPLDNSLLDGTEEDGAAWMGGSVGLGPAAAGGSGLANAVGCGAGLETLDTGSGDLGGVDGGEVFLFS